MHNYDVMVTLNFQWELCDNELAKLWTQSNLHLLFTCQKVMLCNPTDGVLFKAEYTLGRPDLDLFEAHYFLVLLGHNLATLKRKLLDWVIKDPGQAVSRML